MERAGTERGTRLNSARMMTEKEATYGSIDAHWAGTGNGLEYVVGDSLAAGAGLCPLCHDSGGGLASGDGKNAGRRPTQAPDAGHPVWYCFQLLLLRGGRPGSLDLPERRQFYCCNGL